MSQKKLRKIIVDGAPYLWAFRPGYIQMPDVSWRDYLCSDQFIAYAEGHKNSPVRIRFITWECPVSGGPLRCSAPLLLDDPDSLRANLHTPRWAAILIRLALKQGWQAQSAPLTLENGTDLLLEHAAIIMASDPHVAVAEPYSRPTIG
jgi:hypothetical protein